MRLKLGAVLLVFFFVLSLKAQTNQQFDVMETSIDQIHYAIEAGTLTCHSLVQQYLARIRAYDQQGPRINSMIYVNSASLAEADAFDLEFRRSHRLKPLGCIPLVLKDNFEVANLMAKNHLDALIYPHQKCLVVAIGNTFQKDRNGEIAALSGFPAIEVPGGFSAPTKEAPLGVPVGLEILGRAWAEPELIRLAYGFEQASHTRKPPASTPALIERSTEVPNRARTN